MIACTVSSPVHMNKHVFCFDVFCICICFVMFFFLLFLFLFFFLWKFYQVSYILYLVNTNVATIISNLRNNVWLNKKKRSEVLIFASIGFLAYRKNSWIVVWFILTVMCNSIQIMNIYELNQDGESSDVTTNQKFA